MRAKRSPLTFDDVIALVDTLPGAEVSTSYGTPALKVRGKLFARLWEDGVTLVLRVSDVVRAHLLQTDPAVFFLTDHYREHPWVLIRLAVISEAQLQPLLVEAWRAVAPATLRRAHEAPTGDLVPTTSTSRRKRL